MPISFSQYQAETPKTAAYPDSGTGSLPALSYVALGLAGEAGEVANKVKKLIRDEDSAEKRAAILAEAGDCLWYLSQLCIELGGDMGEVAVANLAKLNDRKDRGTIRGDGDNR
jgi:NTP pyrophosphatase (non-canonical NTP hydrolase)